MYALSTRQGPITIFSPLVNIYVFLGLFSAEGLPFEPGTMVSCSAPLTVRLLLITDV